MIRKGIEFICKEYWKIENYEQAANDKKMWDCHHRIEISEDGLHTIYSQNDIKRLGLQQDRQPEELIFLTRSEHMKLHRNTIEEKERNSMATTGHAVSDETREKLRKMFKGRVVTEEWKKKISDSLSGENHPLFGKHLSEETKKKISEKNKGVRGKWHHTEEAKRKISEAGKGRHFVLSEETKKKLSDAIKGRHWFNNGIEETQCYECPEGWHKGRLKFNKKQA